MAIGPCFISRQSKGIALRPSVRDWLLGVPSFLFNDCWGPFLRKSNGWVADVRSSTTRFHRWGQNKLTQHLCQFSVGRQSMS